MKDGLFSEILKNQMELLREACEWDLLPDEAAKLSEALAEALRVAACLGAAAINEFKPIRVELEGITRYAFKPEGDKGGAG